MPPGPGAKIWVVVDRISNKGNGVINLEEGGHINIGPIVEDVVGERIKIQMTEPYRGIPLKSDYRKDVFASPTDPPTSLQIGDKISGKVQNKTPEGMGVIHQDGVRIRVPGAKLGDRVKVQITDLDYNEPGWINADTRRLDSDHIEDSPLKEPLMDITLKEHPNTTASPNTNCPVEDCTYSGSPASVAGHVSGKPQEDHDWERLGYRGAKDFKSQQKSAEVLSQSKESILHVGDVHLGKETGGYGKNKWPIEPAEGWERAIDIALALSVDAVIQTGDLFHTDLPDSIVSTCKEQLERLASAEIPFYYILGNHENEKANQVFDHWGSEGLAQPLSTSPTLVGESIAVYGIDYKEKNWWVSNTLELQKSSTNRYTILGLHQSMSPISNTDKPECGLGDLESPFKTGTGSLDVVALGHLHRSGIKWNNGTAIVCGGAIDKLGKKENSLTPFVGVYFAQGGNLRYRQYPVS